MSTKKKEIPNPENVKIGDLVRPHSKYFSFEEFGRLIGLVQKIEPIEDCLICTIQWMNVNELKKRHKHVEISNEGWDVDILEQAEIPART